MQLLFYDYRKTKPIAINRIKIYPSPHICTNKRYVCRSCLTEKRSQMLENPPEGQKLQEKRKHFALCLNIDKDGARWAFLGRAFHRFGAILWTSHAGVMWRRALDADCRVQVRSHGERRPLRCCGPELHKTLWVRTSTLNWARKPHWSPMQLCHNWCSQWGLPSIAANSHSPPLALRVVLWVALIGRAEVNKQLTLAMRREAHSWKEGSTQNIVPKPHTEHGAGAGYLCVCPLWTISTSSLGYHIDFFFSVHDGCLVSAWYNQYIIVVLS